MCPLGGFPLTNFSPGFTYFLLYRFVGKSKKKDLQRCFSEQWPFLVIMRARARPLSLRTVFKPFWGFPAKKQKERKTKDRLLGVNIRFDAIFAHLKSGFWERKSRFCNRTHPETIFLRHAVPNFTPQDRFVVLTMSSRVSSLWSKDTYPLKPRWLKCRVKNWDVCEANIFLFSLRYFILFSIWFFKH